MLVSSTEFFHGIFLIERSDSTLMNTLFRPIKYFTDNRNIQCSYTIIKGSAYKNALAILTRYITYEHYLQLNYLK